MQDSTVSKSILLNLFMNSNGLCNTLHFCGNIHSKLLKINSLTSSVFCKSTDICRLQIPTLSKRNLTVTDKI